VQTGAAASIAYLFGGATALTTDSNGNLYFALGFSGQPSAVYEIQDGMVRLVAGVNKTNSGGFDGDQGSLLFLPGGLAFGADGGVYISEYYNHRASRVSPNRVRTTIAGSRALPAGSMAPAFALGFASPSPRHRTDLCITRTGLFPRFEKSLPQAK
jgi:hypothetical protein